LEIILDESAWIQNSILYNALFALGDVTQLNFEINYQQCIKQLAEWDSSWQKYNPTDIENSRFGLPYTSLDGSVIDPIGLDSLRNYNLTHGTNFAEEHFDKHTPVSDHLTSLHPVKDFFGANLKRSHFLKLDKSGFFPNHRDSLNFMNFRVIVPINFVPKEHYFLIEDKPVYFERGKIYVVNTIKTHCLFSLHNSMILLVLNVWLDQHMLSKCIRSTRFR
jgi:hypothetical protein